MYFLPFLSLLPLAAALPTHSPVLKRLSCTAQEWNIQQFTAFTAGPSGAPRGAPNIFNFDHITFYFDDPNFNARALCKRSIAKGAGSLSDGRYYSCDAFNMSFQYLGASIELKRTGVPCGNVTYTESGATRLTTNCYALFGGTQCETVAQVNVPIAFLEQTSPQP